MEPCELSWRPCWAASEWNLGQAERLSVWATAYGASERGPRAFIGQDQAWATGRFWIFQ